MNIGSKGATLTEFAMVCVFFFGIIGIMFDFGTAITTYSRLTYVTQIIAKQTASSPDVKGCRTLKETVINFRDDAFTIFGHANDPFWADVLFTVEKVENASKVTGPGDKCALKIYAKNTSPCFFCVMSQAVFNLTPSGKQIIEDQSLCDTIKSCPGADLTLTQNSP